MVSTPRLLLSTYKDVDPKKSAFLASKSGNWAHQGGQSSQNLIQPKLSRKKGRAKYTNRLAIDKFTPRKKTNNLFFILHKLHFQLARVKPYDDDRNNQSEKPFLSDYFLSSILLMRQIHASSRLMYDGVQIN